MKTKKWLSQTLNQLLFLAGCLSLLTGSYIYFLGTQNTALALPATVEEARATNTIPAPAAGGWQENAEEADHYDLWEFYDAIRYDYEYTYQLCLENEAGVPECESQKKEKIENNICGPPLNECFLGLDRKPNMPIKPEHEGSIVSQPEVTRYSWAGEFAGIDHRSGETVDYWTNKDKDLIEIEENAWPPSAEEMNNRIYGPRDEVRQLQEQIPYLIVGYDTTRHEKNTGYHNPFAKIDLWLPKTTGARTITLTNDDLCSGSDNIDSNGSYHTRVWVKDLINAGSYEEVWNGEDDCSLEKKVELQAVNEAQLSLHDKKVYTRELYSFHTGNIELYYKYEILATACSSSLCDPGEDNNLSSSYYNQFRLSVDTKGAYMTFPETALKDSETGAGALGISSRWNSLANKGRNRNLMALWEISFLVAGDSRKGCSHSEHRDIGLFDHDYDSGQARVWQYPVLPPKVAIFAANRKDYAEGKATNFQEIQGSPFIFNDPTKARNKWDEHSVEFFNDQVYKLRFYNLNSPSWVQIKLPYSQINALEKCVHKPLFKVNYADMSAGGRFGTGSTMDACRDDDLSEITAQVYGHTNDYQGSSTQYAAYIHNEVFNFYSRYPYPKDSPPPNPAYQLTPDNQEPERPERLVRNYWGGSFGRKRCLPNYWRGIGALGLESSPANTVNLTTLDNYKSYYYHPSSATEPLTLTNLLVNKTPTLNIKITLYIDGDLWIKNDIFNNNIPFNTLNDLGYITIVARGNIYIASGVKTLDAVLVAYPKPDDDTTGRIYTCYVSDLDTADSPAQKHAEQCSQHKLTVNGALIARRVYLGRTITDDNVRLDDHGVTEEINLLPEYFVTAPQMPVFADWIYHVDSVEILPPNF